MWQVMEGEYRARVDLLDAGASSEPTKEDVALGRHLVTLYALGALGLEGLVSDFFNKANDRLRGRVQGWTAQSIAEDEHIPAAVVVRLQELWDSRVLAAKGDPLNSAEELSAVGAWYATGKFPDAWADAQLRNTHTLGIRVSRAAPVFQRLAGRVRTDLAVALELTEKLLEMIAKEWELPVSAEHVRVVLTAALADEDLRERAVEVVNRLAARGHDEFADLLPGKA